MGRYERIAALAALPVTVGDDAPLHLADLAPGHGRTIRAVLALAGDSGVALRVHAVDTTSSLDDDVLHDERVRSVLADLDQPLPFPDGSLDRVISFNVAEHLADPRAHLTECHRVLRPGGRLVLAHSDWDTALFASEDDALTRRLVDRFVREVPSWAARVDGFMGRKLLCLALGSPFEVLQVESWADCHRRFDEDSIGWKVAMGVLSSTRDEPELAAVAAHWVEGLRRLADTGRFLFTVTDIALALRKPVNPATGGGPGTP